MLLSIREVTSTLSASTNSMDVLIRSYTAKRLNRN